MSEVNSKIFQLVQGSVIINPEKDDYLIIGYVDKTLIINAMNLNGDGGNVVFERFIGYAEKYGLNMDLPDEDPNSVANKLFNWIKLLYSKKVMDLNDFTENTKKIFGFTDINEIDAKFLMFFLANSIVGFDKNLDNGFKMYPIKLIADSEGVYLKINDDFASKYTITNLMNGDVMMGFIKLS